MGKTGRPGKDESAKAAYMRKVLKPSQVDVKRNRRRAKQVSEIQQQARRKAMQAKRKANKGMPPPHRIRVNSVNKPQIAATIMSSRNKREAAAKLGKGTSTYFVDRAVQDPEVRQYIEEIVDGALQEAEVTKAEVLRELRRLAMQNMAHYTRRVGDRIVPDFSRTTFAQMACVTELNADETETCSDDGKRTIQRNSRVKLGGKNQALEMLCKYFHMYGGDGTGGFGPGGMLPPGAAPPPALQVVFVDPKKTKEEKEST